MELRDPGAPLRAAEAVAEAGSGRNDRSGGAVTERFGGQASQMLVKKRLEPDERPRQLAQNLPQMQQNSIFCFEKR